ncbi:MAG TPA: MHYT domain-containing protein [Caulobacteraceae bacterium]|nr:MHYT domain-containing protein [Caulobacteraceae bacterium]
MLKVAACIATEHNPWLVLLAAAVCYVASLTAVNLLAQALERNGMSRRLWLVFSGACAGTGVWATHFIAMLAYSPGLPTGYEVAGTAASLGVGIVGMILTFAVAAWRGEKTAWIAAGALMGAAVGSMHYLGMDAFRTQGRLGWDLPYVAASVTAGVALALPAFALFRRSGGLGRRALTALFLTLSICLLHFTAMAAVTITPNTEAVLPPSYISPGSLVVLITALTGMIVVVAAAMSVVETRARTRASRKLASVIQAMPEGLVYFDAADRCMMWNDCYEAILSSYGVPVAQGDSYADLVSRFAEKALVSGAVGRENAWLSERQAVAALAEATSEELMADGRWLRFQERRTDDGGRVGVLVDITDLKAAVSAAEAANRAKSEFLANMSHEIRTPLNGVLGIADVLARSGLKPHQAEMVGIIRSSGATLNRLLGEILDLARIESGRLEAADEPFQIGETMRDISALVAPAAAEKGLALSLKIAPQAEAWVSGDALRLTQILTNLASNAIKFTREGEVELGVELVAPQTFRFHVRDTGPGLAAADLARVCQRFEQGDGSITRAFGGSGLGLAITRELLGLLGGELACESRPGEGATFSFELALRAAPAANAAFAGPALVEAKDAELRVLIVDDHANNRRLLEVLLSQLGIGHASAEDGVQAVAACRDQPFDIVLMDMQMPVMDGLAATRAIRLEERQAGRPATPIIMISANAMPEHHAASLAAGADAHLSKPLAVDALVEAFNAVLGEAKAERAVA